MSEPKRIRLSRARGWRKPEGVVVVSRPSKWGNPYRLDDYPNVTNPRRQAVADFRHALRYHVGRCRDYPTHAEILGELAGHDLACWCPLDAECHGDELLIIANQEPTP